MSVLFDIILISIFVIFLPYILVGVVLAKIFSAIADIFYLPILGAAFSVFGMACIAWQNHIPDDSRAYSSFVEVIAQSHVFGLQMPYVLAALATVLFVVSASKLFHKAV